jgi:hypothetical protein
MARMVRAKLPPTELMTKRMGFIRDLAVSSLLRYRVAAIIINNAAPHPTHCPETDSGSV